MKSSNGSVQVSHTHWSPKESGDGGWAVEANSAWLTHVHSFDYLGELLLIAGPHLFRCLICSTFYDGQRQWRLRRKQSISHHSFTTKLLHTPLFHPFWLRG